MKRSYSAGGGSGYGDDALPLKLPATASAWQDFSQNDSSMGGDGQGMFARGTSFESGPPQTGADSSHGGMSQTIDRLKTMSGTLPTNAYTNQDSSYPSVRFSGFQQNTGGYDYGYKEQGGYNQGSEYYRGEGYNGDDSYDQNYGFENYGCGEQQTGWDYEQSGGEYFGVYGGASFVGGQRGQGQGQGRGQGHPRGRGGQTTRGGSGLGNQSARGQGRGQPGGRGQVRGFTSGGPGNWGRGRGQNGNYQGQSGNFRGRNATNRQRGRGRGSLGGTGYGNGSFSSTQQNQRGFNKAGRGPVGGYGNPRGKVTGPTASQVKSISDNIMGMVTTRGRGRGGAGGRGGQRGRGGGQGKPTSLMDLVDTARHRKLGTGSSSLSEEANRLAQFVEFFTTYPDRVNGIQTVSNALSASRLNLKIEFEAEELIFITKPLFTGVLTLGGFFLTRGLGLSKKAVKHDCFQRAVEILRTNSVDEILKLEDCGKEALRQEVQHQSETDFDSFKSFLSIKQNPSSMSDITSQTDKTQQKQAAEMETSEKIRTAAVSESQVAERNFPLSDKMMMLVKELEKAENEEASVAMASRFDVLCFKVGISVTALFLAVDPSHARPFYTQPYKGDPDLDLICEIYYDGVQVGKGQGKPRKEAQAAAYSNIHSRLLSEPISTIVQGPQLHSQPESLPGYFEVIYKGVKPIEGNNHARLHALHWYPPDFSKKVEDIVIIEMPGETIEDNAYKILEFSASKNAMLLEWKYLDRTPTADGFRCEISLNRQKTVTGVGQSKIKSRNTAAAMILMELYQSQDVISFNSRDEISQSIPMPELTERAEELKAEGPPRTDRVECFWQDYAKTDDTLKGKAKEKTDDSDKEMAKEMTDDSDKEMAKEMTDGSEKEMAKEMTDDSDKEMAKEMTDDSEKEMAKEMTDDSDKEMAKEKTNDSEKEMAKEMTDDSDKEMAKEITDDSDKEMAKEKMDDSDKETLKEKADDSGKVTRREEAGAGNQAWQASPLRQWLEDAIVEAMEGYKKKVTLEELVFGPGVNETMRRFCCAAARHCLLSPPNVKFNSKKEMFFCFHHRAITPQEMVKILHVCKNTSGKYTLVRANKPVSMTQQAQFVRSFPDQWQARARAHQEAERQEQEKKAARRRAEPPSE